MYKRVLLLLLILTLVIPLVLSNKVFIGAEGFGTDTIAGNQGQIIKVTNLNDNGPGSLREAINTKGPRLIVFEVSGTIELKDRLVIWEPYVTIAGQTAPSPGITLKDESLRIKTHDVLVQHLRVRVGDKTKDSDPSTLDGIDITGYSDGSLKVYNVVIDHCSVSWTIDEAISTWYEGVHDVTISNCIVSEALADSLHPDGIHSI